MAIGLLYGEIPKLRLYSRWEMKLISNATVPACQYLPKMALILERIIFTQFYEFDLLLQNLFKFGISGKLMQLWSSYLSYRHQCVRIRNTRSNFLPNISGVPQNSILGQLLFFICINDMRNVCKKSAMFLFADDSTTKNSNLLHFSVI